MDFSISRLVQLIKRDFQINARVFILLILSLLIITSFIMFLSTEEYCNSDSPIIIVDVIFFVGLFMSGAILSSSIFTEFRHPSSRSYFLSLPATTTEKWLSKWIICVPIHLILSIFLIVISYKLFGNVLHNIWAECHFVSLLDLNSDKGRYTSLYKYNFIRALKIYFVFQAFCFLFGILYNKNSFLKTLISVLILCFVFKSGTNILFGTNPRWGVFVMSNSFANITYFLTPLIWLASYYTLKEKQI